MKSQSVSGPIGWPIRASCRRRCPRAWQSPPRTSARRPVRYATRQHVDEKPGPVLGLDRRLPIRSANARAVATSGLVSSATTTRPATSPEPVRRSAARARARRCSTACASSRDRDRGRVRGDDRSLGRRRRRSQRSPRAWRLLVLGHRLDHETRHRRTWCEVGCQPRSGPLISAAASPR